MATIGATTAKKQDMPPPGGYRPVSFKRIPARTYFSGFAIIGGYFAMTFGGLYLYYLNCKLLHLEEIELRSAKFAIFPMLLAERDREYLRQLRKNRDEEAKLMANVEGWKVGTYYGEPIYKTVPENTLIEPNLFGYYIHAKEKDFKMRGNLPLWY